MRDLTTALQIAEQFTSPDDTPAQDVLALLRVLCKKIHRLEMSHLDALQMIEAIRYTNWPSDEMRAAMNAEDMDELILEGERAIAACRRKTTTRKLRISR